MSDVAHNNRNPDLERINIMNDITTAAVEYIRSVGNNEHNTIDCSDSVLAGEGVWSNLFKVNGETIAKTNSKGQWVLEDYAALERALPVLDQMRNADEPVDLDEVMSEMGETVERLAQDSFGKCQTDAPEASVKGDAEANLLGESCELLAGKDWGQNMFTIKGKLKGDTHVRNYGFSFKQYGQVSLIFFWREIRDIRPNVESRWEAVELNGNKQIAYRNQTSDGWRFQKKTVLFWSDMIASFDWSPEEMERYVGDHPFYQLLMN